MISNSNASNYNPFGTNINHIKEIQMPINDNQDGKLSESNRYKKTNLLFSTQQLKAQYSLKSSLIQLSKANNKYNINPNKINELTNRSKVGNNLDTKDINKTTI
ncbi:MAG: hypothetical protein A2104_04920 [Candidatus Melainabacteria bacterium GWF2_32_7]|nr:MAG: hypothetical protein A2104_04920 [Candidatus Melainabacteria bacterium GWF2_32_7]